jgi:hypothetical protein
MNGLLDSNANTQPTFLNEKHHRTAHNESAARSGAGWIDSVGMLVSTDGNEDDDGDDIMDENDDERRQRRRRRR